MSEIRVDTISEKTSANGVSIDGLTIKDGGIAATLASTITTADNTDTLTLISTDADASQGPNLRLYRNSSSPADSDLIGTIDFEGRNNNSEDVVYAKIKSEISAVADGNEYGVLSFESMRNGTLTTAMQIGSGINISVADNADNLTLISTDADDNSGPNLRMYRNSGSPANNDVIGQIQFEGRNNNSEDVVYSDISMKIADVADGNEDGIIRFRCMNNGTLRQYLSTSSTETVFNEDSQDIDFRVESDNKTHAFFVEGSDGGIGIGTGTIEANAQVHIEGAEEYLVIKHASQMGIKLYGDDTNVLYSYDKSGNSLTGGITFNHADGTMIFQNNGSTERMRISSTGKIGINLANTGTAMLKIGIPNAQYGLETKPEVNQTYYAAIFRNSSGNDVGRIESTASATSFVTSSDYRLKENVSYDFDATTRLKQLKPSRFNFINTPDTTVDGFLAHEVSSIVPEAISGTKDATETKEKVVVDANGQVIVEGITEAEWTAGKVADEDGNTQYPSNSTWEASKVVPVYQGIDQSKLVPLLVKTIQELEARITTLEG